MIEETNILPPQDVADNERSAGCAASTCCLSSVAEMEALEKAIQKCNYGIRQLQDQLATMRKKQDARQHELGYQKARMGLKPSSRVSDDARPGHRMVIVQTDAGIATRWIRDNDNMEVPNA